MLVIPGEHTEHSIRRSKRGRGLSATRLALVRAADNRIDRPASIIPSRLGELSDRQRLPIQGSWPDP